MKSSLWWSNFGSFLCDCVVFVCFQNMSQMLIITRFLELTLFIGDLLSLRYQRFLLSMILHRTNACREIDKIKVIKVNLILSRV